MADLSPYRIELSPEERECIERLVRSQTARHALVQRATIIFFAAEGWDNVRIAKQLGLARRTVSIWRKRFFMERLDGLVDRPRPGRPRAFPPPVEAEVKAVACALPKETGVPLSRLSSGDIHRAVLKRGLLRTPSAATIRRWLAADPIKPWQYRMWISPVDPRFREKAEPVLDLYAGFWQGKPLGPGECVICIDEKTSIQARARMFVSTLLGPHQVRRIEFDYTRKGAWVYAAAWDVRRAKPFGICRKKNGIKTFRAILDHIMSQEPYRSARRLFIIVDNGSSHRGESAKARLAEWYPNAILVNTPVHASWLNQIELYFSIVQRKVLTPNTFENLADLEHHLMAFQTYYASYAKPFKWRFTKKDLHHVLANLGTSLSNSKLAA